jgi:regulator of sigma D
MSRDQAETDIVHAVNELLEERQQLLVSFCRAAGLDTGGKPELAVDQPVVLKRLCQVLMDYYALWQFEIHAHLLKNKALYSQALIELQQAGDRLDESRNIAVAFNDKYDFESRALRMEGLENDLSLLGEEIAQQIGAEDRIIHAMGKSRQQTN